MASRMNKRLRRLAGPDCQSIATESDQPKAPGNLEPLPQLNTSTTSPQGTPRKRPASIIGQDNPASNDLQPSPSLSSLQNPTLPVLSKANLDENEKRLQQQQSSPNSTSYSTGLQPRQPLEVNSQSSSPPPGNDNVDEPVIKQLKTRPITEEQLNKEAQNIYADLYKVEKTCMEMDKQLLNGTKNITNELYTTLFDFHETLLHKHVSLLLCASQYPSSSEGLRKLATKYLIPARMWRHGIHAFLELLRHQLPKSLEHMLSFIYTAYVMMTLLVESVPIFMDTWTHCLGDLARYRMSVEGIGHEDREIWAGMAGHWYRIAADKSPNCGRIQHHLAVLARPLILDQLFYYTKSLVCVQPFTATREDILPLFDSLPDVPDETAPDSWKFIYSFAKAHATLFEKQPILSFLKYSREFLIHLSDQTGSYWQNILTHIASINFTALLEYGADGMLMKSFMNTVQLPKSRLDTARRFWRDSPLFQDNTANHRFKSLNSEVNFTSSLDMVSYGSFLIYRTMTNILKRIGDKYILPYMHISLSFLWSLAQVPETMKYIEADIPWCTLVTFLNTLNHQGVSQTRLANDEFPTDSNGLSCHLPEDFVMRGQIWSQLYYPEDFFQELLLDNEERLLESSSIETLRTTRCLWLGCRIASLGRWISYKSQEQKFYATEFAVQLESVSKRENILDAVPRLLAERQAHENT